MNHPDYPVTYSAIAIPRNNESVLSIPEFQSTLPKHVTFSSKQERIGLPLVNLISQCEMAGPEKRRSNFWLLWGERFALCQDKLLICDKKYS